MICKVVVLLDNQYNRIIGITGITSRLLTSRASPSAVLYDTRCAEEAEHVTSVQCRVYSVQCTLYSVQCEVYSVQCTVHSVQFTVCSVHCTLYVHHQAAWRMACVDYWIMDGRMKRVGHHDM